MRIIWIIIKYFSISFCEPNIIILYFYIFYYRCLCLRFLILFLRHRRGAIWWNCWINDNASTLGFMSETRRSVDWSDYDCLIQAFYFLCWHKVLLDWNVFFRIENKTTQRLCIKCHIIDCRCRPQQIYAHHLTMSNLGQVRLYNGVSWNQATLQDGVLS